MKKFIKHLRLFLTYLVTQPIIEIINLFRISAEKTAKYSYISAWRNPLLLLTIIFYIAGNTYMTKFFCALLILAILKTEWDDKKWLEKQIEKERKKAEKKYETGG